MDKNLLDVHGKNELNRIIVLILENLLPQLNQYVGKKIQTQTGKSSKFVVNLLNAEPKPIENGFAKLHLNYIDFQHGEIVLKVSISLNGGKYEDRTYYCQYFNGIIHIGKMDNMTLVSVYDIDEIIKDYGFNNIIDLEAEKAKIKRLRELEDQISELKSSIKINY